MRPARILVFFLVVIATLSLLSLLTVGKRSGSAPSVHTDDSLFVLQTADSSDEDEAAGSVDLPGKDNLTRRGDLPGVDLPGVDLPGVDLSGVDLPGVDLPGVDLSGVDLPGAGEPAGISDPQGTVKVEERAAVRQPAAAALRHPGEALLDSLAAGRQVRLIYYGDSQVEGDRLTSLMREELRKGSDGTGPGMFLPVMPVTYTRSFVVRSSSNWKRYTLLDHRNGLLPHNRLGPMLALCRFTPPEESRTSRSFATVKITPVPGADSTVSRYDNLRILYGNNFDTLLVGIHSGRKLIDFSMLQMGEGPMEYSIPLGGVSEVTVEFSGNNSPDIYALSLESSSGVIVDNIPVRGSAGLEFVMTDIRGFEGCYQELKPDMIFLHFGLNVVRNVRSEYHYYEEGLLRQINYLKEASGGTPVVVVSVTDMALADNDTIRHFPNIRAIRDAQKSAAARGGAYFWDAWESMGGTGSVLGWRNHQPPLASKDLTHLSNAGIDTIAVRLLNYLLPQNLRGSSGYSGREPYITAASSVTPATPDVTPATPDVTPATPDVTPATADAIPATPDVTPAQGATLDATSGSSPEDAVPVPEAASGGIAGMATIAGSAESPATERQQEVEVTGRLSSIFSYHPDQTFIFTTAGFWIFFLVVMAGFALLHNRRAMCHTWLLMVSLYFYYRAGGLFIILLLVTTALTYGMALMIGRTAGRGGRRFWLTAHIVLLLGFLSYFKYAGFFTGVINSMLNTNIVVRDIFSVWSNSLFGTNFNVSTIILPVGISFFTFQALSYTIDIYKGKMAAERNFIDFAFYLTFFPQLVAGPIVRASEFIPQMRGDYSITRNEFGHGLFLILQGLIKKRLISDFIATAFIDRVFEMPAIYSGFENLMAVYGYGLQIYCDFSGYTDIAIGIAMLMGFRLPLNFNSPYKAVSVTDFWRRWHISLSRWLKDYLYIPLGGNRKGTFRTGINLMITMLLGGLWHGAAMRFVVWGGLHGVALVAEKIWHFIFSGRSRRRGVTSVIGILLTFNFVSFAWIFFRASSIDHAAIMLTQIFSSFSPGNWSHLMTSYLPVMVLIVTGFILHFLPVTVKESYRGLFIRLPLAGQLAAALLVAVLLYKSGGEFVQPFIYFRF